MYLYRFSGNNSIFENVFVFGLTKSKVLSKRYLPFMDINFIPLILLAFLSYVCLAFAGFGGILIPITLGAHFYSIKWMLPVLLPLTTLSNLYIFLRYFQKIDKAILMGRIVPFMGVGVVIGIAAFHMVRGDLLVKILGILVILLSLKELNQIFRTNHEPVPISRVKSIAYVFLAGILHGLYASGGPPLVYVLNKSKLHKTVFRSTLAAVWLTMNIFILFTYFITGKITQETGMASIILIPAMVSGIMLGDYMHRKIDDRLFKILIFFLLLLTGISIVMK